MVLNIILNLILIPAFGSQAYLGAAIAALISSVFLFSAGYYWVGKIVAYSRRLVIIQTMKVVAASAALAMVLILLRESLQLVFLVPLGAVTYLAVLWLVGGINKQEISEFYKSFGKKPVAVNVDDL